MGQLSSPDATETIPLPARALVGRSRACDVCVAGAAVSGEHATLTWGAGGWSVRDLGSRNGTFVAGRRLDAGASASLVAGDRIGFGAPDPAWTLADAGPPAPMARRLSDRALRVGEGDVLLLPDDAHPLAVIAPLGEGWFDEVRGEEVADHDVITVEGAPWLLRLPAEVEGTQLRAAAVSLDAVTLELAVSQDEEFVQVAVEVGGQRVAIEPRSYHYTLLTLARVWLADADATPAERGWVDAEWLAERLRTQRRTLDVQICRIRNQFRALGFVGADRVVDRRRGTSAVRLGVSRVWVRALGE